MKAFCPDYKGSKIVKQGFRHNESGRKQKYQCRTCGSYFVVDDGFKRMRTKPKAIVRAIHMYADGLSLSKVQNHMYQHDNIKVSRWAINKWVNKYSDALKKTVPGTETKDKRQNPHGRKIRKGWQSPAL